MANADFREIPAGDDKGCRRSGRGFRWGRSSGAGGGGGGGALIKVELHLVLFFFDGLVQTRGNLTRCLFDHAFPYARIILKKPQVSGEESEERAPPPPPPSTMPELFEATQRSQRARESNTHFHVSLTIALDCHCRSAPMHRGGHVRRYTSARGRMHTTFN